MRGDPLEMFKITLISEYKKFFTGATEKFFEEFDHSNLSTLLGKIDGERAAEDWPMLSDFVILADEVLGEG